jgi:DNA-binding PadR family transcriptional regulator
MEIDIANLEIEMNRGFLQILVLMALEQKMYGYKMIKFFEEQGYPVEENTLYPILRRLEKNGWVKSEWNIGKDRPRKFYRISIPGRLLRERALSIWSNQNDILRRLTKENLNVSKS